MATDQLHDKVQAFLNERIGLYINGTYVEATSGKTFDVLDPATEEVVARVQEAGVEDIDLAVASARKAFDEGEWTKMEPAERAHIMYTFANLLEEHQAEIAQIESLDAGKPYAAAFEDDVGGTIEHFRYYAGWATKISGKTTNVSNDYVTYTLHEPVGVVGQIIPWNYPLLMAAWKLGAALAVGCTIVIKPAVETPLSLLYIADLFKQAGFPDGVVNIVPGDGAVAGGAIVTHKDVDKVAFTGSTVVGKEIMRNAADQVKSVTLELGGKSPAIILEDADFEAAVQGALDGTMYNQGQNCTATTRVFVQGPIYEKVVDELAKRAKEIQLGSGLDESTTMGPLISKKQQDRVLTYIEKGKEEGARLVIGGGKGKENGFFIEPTIFADVEDHMTIAREEIFGPVMSVLPFDTVEEVIQRANDSDYGLAASVWTNHIKKAHYITGKLQAGTVWVNDFGLELETMPFGGYKQSGIGREMGGDYGLMNYVEVKSVFINMEQ